MKDVAERGLVLLGCGKMGSALLAGWLEGGLSPEAVWVLDPNPSDWLARTGVHVNEGVPTDPAVALVAVKPQMMGEALPTLQALGNGATLFVSIAAGTPIAAFEAALGEQTPIIRSMPNTPAAVGKGITAIIGNARAGEADMATASALLSAVGQVVRLEDESQMDAVTGLSGSGPAYVFLLAEVMEAAAIAQGLPAELARRMARSTVAGSGALLAASTEDAGQLRRNVTSPKGTTERALASLQASAVKQHIVDAVLAANARAIELGIQLGTDPTPGSTS